MNNTPLIGYTTFCLYISWLTFGLIQFFWLLWKMMLWKFIFKFLFECMLSILLSIYLGMKLLYCIVILFYFLRNCQTVFHSDFNILQPFENASELQFLTNPFCLLFCFWMRVGVDPCLLFCLLLNARGCGSLLSPILFVVECARVWIPFVSYFVVECSWVWSAFYSCLYLYFPNDNGTGLLSMCFLASCRTTWRNVHLVSLSKF